MAILNDSTGTLMSCGHRNHDCRMGVIIGKTLPYVIEKSDRERRCFNNFTTTTKLDNRYFFYFSGGKFQNRFLFHIKALYFNLSL